MANGFVLNLLEKNKPLNIRINSFDSKLTTPKVDLRLGLIQLHESHLSYLWCMIYSFMSLLDFTEKRIAEGQTYIVMTDAPELIGTNSIFTWAVSLKRECSNWPANLPSPAGVSQDCDLTNRIFIQAVLYIVYHELGHLSIGHDQYLPLITKQELTEEESQTLKLLECEADNFAFDCLKEVDETEDSTLINVFAASVAHMSNLYLITNTADLLQMKHPDVDTRIFNLMNKVQFENEHHKSGMDLIYNIGLSLFINQLSPTYLTEDMSFESFDDILNYLYSCLDIEKSKVPPLKFRA
ncbi:MAG: phage exclusion protein Lit family protein [Mucilaginibacter sp.]|uniref:phage exclusion protein Lit family protein n=1 Tax=Mucilaginibacter sp. TaxID=1882438 RepID=UPI0031A3587A